MESFFQSHPDVFIAIENAANVVKIAAKSENAATVKHAHENMLTELGKLSLKEKLYAYDQLNDQFQMYTWCRNYITGLPPFCERLSVLSIPFLMHGDLRP